MSLSAGHSVMAPITESTSQRLQYSRRCQARGMRQWRTARDDKAETAGCALARRQGQEICASATDEAKAPTFSVAFSPSLITLTLNFCAPYSSTTRDPSQSLFCILHTLAVADSHTHAPFISIICSLTPVTSKTSQCPTAEDTVAADAMADAAAATGTKTALQEVERTTTTTTQANTHRTGTTISP
jgi:hypothetical protein